MEPLSIVFGAVVLAIVFALYKARRTTSLDLGSVSRDWVLRHSTDEPWAARR